MNDANQFLYKYRAIDPNDINKSKKIFTENSLYFSTRDQFNDPFDCKSRYSFSASDKDLKKYFAREIGRNFPSVNREEKQRMLSAAVREIKKKNPEFLSKFERSQDKLFSEIGICSLTSMPNDILMWSHYADSHKGFCIKFFDDPSDQFIARAQKISYSEEYPVVNPIKDDDLTRFKKTLLTKAKHWDYEKEWRIIDYETGPGIKIFPPHLLVGIIFGCNMSGEHKKLIREWCAERQHSVTFYQAEEAPDTYSLKIKEV